MKETKKKKIKTVKKNSKINASKKTSVNPKSKTLKPTSKKSEIKKELVVSTTTTPLNIISLKTEIAEIKEDFKKTFKSKKKAEKRDLIKWIKTNVIENEKEFSKANKNRRLFTSLFAVLCFCVVVFSTAIIDYTNAVKRETTPFFVIKGRNEYKQATIYYGAFYKAWKCDNGSSTVTFGRYKNELTYCPVEPVYDEQGVYTNPNGVKITRSQMNNIKEYYRDEFVYFENEGELEIALNLSTAINKSRWVKTKSEVVLNGDPTIEIAIFNALEEKDGIQSWERQYTNTKYHKCVKSKDDDYFFSNYDPVNMTCEGEWTKLKLDDTTCLLASKSVKFVSEFVTITKLCD